tara:strand:+ start:531 stop:812 length:282 start_codon:yes stop_codon:yes gene_type:complete
MKKILLLSITGMFLMSCGGGWSDEDVAKAMKDCTEQGGNSESACECVIEKSESKFESYEAMMNKMDIGPVDTEEEAELFKWVMEVSKDCGIDL